MMKNLGIKLNTQDLLNIKGGNLGCPTFICECQFFWEPMYVTECNANPATWCQDQGLGQGTCQPN